MPFGGRAVSLLNGFSGGAAGDGAGLTVILGFGVESTGRGVAGVVEHEGPALSPSAACPVVDFTGPDSFSILRLRI